MQILQHEVEPVATPQDLDVHPTLRGLMADQASAYADEVRQLRQRVASLESELAAAKLSNGAPAVHHVEFGADTATSSEFVESTAPAVVSIDPTRRATAPIRRSTSTSRPGRSAAAPSPAIRRAPVTDESATDGTPVPNPGFAEAWSADDEAASFEERVAERAFFAATVVDEESRTWLLAQ